MRETLKETWLPVRANEVIGSRMHPVTTARVVYIAVELAEPTEIRTASADLGGRELVEVRW